MPALFRHAMSDTNITRSNGQDETVPLFRPMPQTSVGTLCLFVVAACLTASWCLMDSWNHDVSSELFGLAEVTKVEASGDTLRHFNAPLMLAFVQFLFMGILFSMMFFSLVPTAWEDLLELRQSGFNWTWASLIVTHVFSNFWLQALMMPKQPLSLGMFAASRSLEVPAAAAIRTKIFNTRPRRRDLVTLVLVFAAAWQLFFSYAQLSQCLCIWSGFGVELTGFAFAIIFTLMLAIPAWNFVSQESVMTHFGVHPLLLLGCMNLGASIVCLPLVLVAHCAGQEDYAGAWHLIQRYPQVCMLIVWLCVQMSIACGLSTSLIVTVNSFWAVALRSFRVVFWWLHVLIIFYFRSDGGLLSTSLPHESFWSFVMFCGVCCMAVAISVETRAEDAPDKTKLAAATAYTAV